jgi:UDP-glucose 4-epimerase
MNKKKKVLITGVAGFIGSNLADRLVREGVEVLDIDDLSQGYKRNIKCFKARDNFKFIKADVRDNKRLKDIFKRTKFDLIYHLAAYKIPRYGNAMDTLMINAKGTECMLEAARTTGARFIFASTSDVYGKNRELPFSEDSDLVLGPTNVKRWAYASSKIFDEHLCFAYEEKYGLPVTIVRFFGGYGPNQNTTWWGGPQSVFIDCALKNKYMTLHGSGKQTRSFTYIEDTVECLTRIMERSSSTGEVLNIGNDREITIKKLAEMIWKMVRGTNPRIKYIPYDKLHKGYEDVIRRVPDTSKVRKLLGFEARISLEEGLPITIVWQKKITGV